MHSAAAALSSASGMRVPSSLVPNFHNVAQAPAANGSTQMARAASSDWTIFLPFPASDPACAATMPVASAAASSALRTARTSSSARARTPGPGRRSSRQSARYIWASIRNSPSARARMRATDASLMASQFISSIADVGGAHMMRPRTALFSASPSSRWSRRTSVLNAAVSYSRAARASYSSPEGASSARNIAQMLRLIESASRPAWAAPIPAATVCREAREGSQVSSHTAAYSIASVARRLHRAYTPPAGGRSLSISSVRFTPARASAIASF